MVGGEAMPETDSTVGGVLAALGEQRIYVGPVGAAAAVRNENCEGGMSGL